MAGLKEIKRRLQSVKNTKKTTYAMKLVSAAKLRRIQDTVINGRAYSEALSALVGDLIAGAGIEGEGVAPGGEEIAQHPLMIRRAVKKTLLVVIGGSRGLAGGYNSNLNKAVDRFIRDREDPKSIEIVSLGKKPSEHIRRFRYQLREAFDELPEDPNTWPLQELTEQFCEMFVDGSVDEVFILYTHFGSALDVSPKLEKLLPLEKVAASSEDKSSNRNRDSSSSEYIASSRQKVIFEPSREEVLAQLLPRILLTFVRQACLHAKASEYGSRMTAMDAATKNAGDLIEKLQLKYNKLRQTGITSELLDILGGAEALK